MPDTLMPPRQAQRAGLILVDDHRMFVDALAERLSRDYEIRGVAYNAAEALSLLDQCEPDCLLLDLQMPVMNGLELLRRIRRLRARLAVLVVTMLLDREMAIAALDAGARGFIPKDARLPELISAIEAVLNGNDYISPLVPKLSHRVNLAGEHAALHRLTPRQHAVFLRIGDGRSGTEIASELGVSPNTVTFHKQRIMYSLGIQTDSALRRYAVLVAANAIASRE